MSEQTEYLNLEYHTAILVKKALAKFKTEKEAAHALGITTRTLSRWKERFELEMKHKYKSKLKKVA